MEHNGQGEYVGEGAGGVVQQVELAEGQQAQPHTRTSPQPVQRQGGVVQQVELAEGQQAQPQTRTSPQPVLILLTYYTRQ